ncbi:MAG: hypothetical protein N3B18_03120 [Desulfobacterota bacterium]|nr:hypothetical protein [Thermodesulfobacteriota bacterium]
MKVSIGMRLQPGPWGGGNQFGHALASYLRKKHVEVCFDLNDRNIDIILLAEPRRELRISAYNDHDIVKYLLKTRSHALVVHRVNECDERKGTSTVNARLRRAARCADHTVFVSEWLRDLHLKQGFPCREHSVIRNGSDTTVFSPDGYRPWNGTEPLRLVTHHWSSHPMKGFALYKRIDDLLEQGRMGGAISYTYIGNLPEGFSFRRARYLPPLSGHALAAELRRHHVYVTASVNEPGPHHVNEAACCGLPLLYLKSGAVLEYCDGFGIAFTEANFEDKLKEMMLSYHTFVARMPNFPLTANAMCAQYETLFQNLIMRRDELIKRRHWLQHPLWLLRMLCSGDSSNRDVPCPK